MQENKKSKVSLGTLEKPCLKTVERGGGCRLATEYVWGPGFKFWENKKKNVHDEIGVKEW